MRFSRSTIGVAAAIGLTAQALFAPVGAGSTNTADNRVLVVIANVEEAYGQGTRDTANMFEIANFVKRLVPQTPFFPDVLLLQEVNYKSAGLVAQQMSKKTGQRYIVAVRPVRRTTVVFPNRSVHTETGIVINARTMKIAKRGGFYAASYPKSASAPGVDPHIRRHAHVMLQEKATGLKVPVMSVHFTRERDMKSRTVSNFYRGEWAKEIEALMQRRYRADAAAKASNVGGDFNMVRCVSGNFASCKVARFWKIFTSAPHKYADSLFDMGLPAGVDIIFTNGDVFDGGWDENGQFPESDRKNYYSDHRFRWAVVGKN